MTGTWLNGSTVGRDPKELERWLDSDVVRMVNYAVGDGSDEAVGLQAALSKCALNRSRLQVEHGKTYVSSQMLTASDSMLIEGNGACFKKSAGLNNYVLKITGPDVHVIDLEGDGNRAGGNTGVFGCIWFNGLRGVARRTFTHNAKGAGTFASGASVVADIYDCESHDIVTSPTVGDGFQYGAGALMNFYGACKANLNGHCGFHHSASAVGSCHMFGTPSAESNNFAGATFFSDGGVCPYIYTRNNGVYGIYGQQAAGWTIGTHLDEDSGHAISPATYTMNPAATAAEFLACDKFDYADQIARRPLGYGIALSQLSGVGTTNFAIGRMSVDTPGDPGLFIGGGSSYNHVNSLVCYGDVALSFSEGVTGSNDYNTIDLIDATACGFVTVRGTLATHTKIGRIVATDCWNRPGYTGLVQWQAATCQYNAIGGLAASNYGTIPFGATMPTCIMSVDLGSLHNWIMSGYSRNIATPLIDANAPGSNQVDFAAGP